MEKALYKCTTLLLYFKICSNYTQSLPKVVGGDFHLVGSWKTVVRYRCKTTISILQFDEKK